MLLNWFNGKCMVFSHWNIFVNLFIKWLPWTQYKWGSNYFNDFFFFPFSSFLLPAVKLSFPLPPISLSTSHLYFWPTIYFAAIYSPSYISIIIIFLLSFTLLPHGETNLIFKCFTMAVLTCWSVSCSAVLNTAGLKLLPVTTLIQYTILKMLHTMTTVWMKTVNVTLQTMFR